MARVGNRSSGYSDQDSPPAVGPAIAGLASRQHGVICVAQLHDLGLDKHGIRRRLASGFLHPVHRGVFSVGVTIVSLRGRYLAAVVACGTGAALSHRSAADLWGLRPNATRLEVTVPAKRPGPPWVEVHRTRVLAPQDFTTRDGIPVTSVARTLLDLGAVVRPPDLEVAVDRAERLGIFDLTAGPCGGWSPPIAEQPEEPARAGVQDAARYRAGPSGARLQCPGRGRGRNSRSRRLLGGAEARDPARRLRVPPHAPGPGAGRREQARWAFG
jgi:hypothetical protein